MNYITNQFDTETLEIDNITLSDIPDFTIENFIELKELQDKNKETMLVGDENKRLITLQFLKASDNARDMVDDGAFPEYDEEHAKRALETFARAKLI